MLRSALPLLLVAASAFTSFSSAQQTPVPRVVAGGCGVQALDGVLWAIGPSYKARFTAGGVEFTPALGRGSPRNRPLALRCLSVGRDGAAVQVAAAEPTMEGLQVRYERAACVERYDASDAGIALSYAFGRLPAGTGDLVVRLQVDTDLPLTEASAMGLRFVGEHGGVAIGAVTGVDARGARAPGALAYDGTTLELRLPASFVDEAALPLVLDPQIGPVFPITSGPVDYESPCVAPMGGGGSAFLAVWMQVFSVGNTDVVAQRLDANGSLVGGPILVTSSGGGGLWPKVAAVTNRQAYVVVYQRSADLYARPITATGVVGAEVAVATGSDTVIVASLGGELTSVDDDVVCVYENSTQDKIQAQQIQVNASGTLSVFAPVDLAGGLAFASVAQPRVSATGGSSGRYLVVYSQRLNGSPEANVRGLVINRNLAVLASATLVGTADDEEAPAVDGNGSEWVVAYETEVVAGSVNNDIHAVPVAFDAAAGQLVVGTPGVVSAVANVEELAPEIAFLGASCLVSWQRRPVLGSENTDLFLRSVDTFTCTQCEPTALLVNSADAERRVSIAASLLEGSEGPVLVLWERLNISLYRGTIEGIVYGGDDGVYGGAGGGCGEGGRCSYSCARVGNANFRFRLRDARPAATTWLVIATQPNPVTCNGCTLVPDVFGGVIGSALVTDGHGHAEQPLAIPATSAVRGINLLSQWIVTNPTGTCSFLQTDFSTYQSVFID